MATQSYFHEGYPHGPLERCLVGFYGVLKMCQGYLRGAHNGCGVLERQARGA
jgi:hypothetical protein